MSKSPIYLDYAAATPVDADVLQAMQPYYSDKFYNPSATYKAANEVRKALEQARGSIAHWLGAKPSEIIFTAGGTEANNLAIHGVMSQLDDANIVISGIEHESVIAAAENFKLKTAAVKSDGRIDLEDLRSKIDSKTALISVMYANNEIGTIQPIREVAKLVAEERESRRKTGNKLSLFLHTDACQAANYLDLHAARLGVDIMTINGGKIYGPKQSAVLYVKAGIVLKPLIYGGGQERGIRSGTENIVNSVGLAAALDLAQKVRHNENGRLLDLQKQFMNGIKDKLPSAVINGSHKFRLPNNIHVTFPNVDNERLLIQLDKAGIMAAAGSACSASDNTPSHVLRAIGLSDDNAQSSIRITMGRKTTEAEVNQVLAALAHLTTLQ